MILQTTFSLTIRFFEFDPGWYIYLKLIYLNWFIVFFIAWLHNILFS